VSLDPLNGQVRRLFGSLKHAGHLSCEEPAEGLRTLSGEAGREQRGTRIRFTLLLRGSDPIEVRYQAYGCPHTLAVCEWLAGELECGRGASIGGPADWARTLGVPVAKLGRLLVVEDALRNALGQIGPATENVVK
jgi:hypothetical protein